RWQFVPAQLLFQAVGFGLDHPPVVVDRAGGARRDAVVAPVALVDVDHIVARVVGDGPHRTDRLAGVAADADLGVDQVLLDDGGFSGGVHLRSPDACGYP